jgi:hypothetical protein
MPSETSETFEKNKRRLTNVARVLEQKGVVGVQYTLVVAAEIWKGDVTVGKLEANPGVGRQKSEYVNILTCPGMRNVNVCKAYRIKR